MGRVLGVLLVLGCAACQPPVEISVTLPAAGGELALVALVEADDEGDYRVLDHTALFEVTAAVEPLRADVASAQPLRLAVFTYDAAALAAAVAPGLTAEDLAARTSVELAVGGQVLPRAGRTDWVSPSFTAEAAITVEVLPAADSADALRVRDRAEAQLMLRVPGLDAGLDAAADAGRDAASDAGLDSGADAGSDASADSGCSFGPPLELSEVNLELENESSPAVSADGLTLLLVSTRPGAGGLDIFISARSSTADPFGEPAALPEINTASYDYFPALSADGLTLYFASDRAGGEGQSDIWVASRPTLAMPFDAPSALAEVNGADWEMGSSVSADGLTIYFASDRAGGAGSVDIWTATRPSAADPFGSLTNLAGSVNTVAEETDPAIGPNGLTLYLASDRAGGLGGLDLYFAVRPSLAADFGVPENLETINSDLADTHPSITGDGRTLYFASNRIGGAGGWDIWRATRPCP